MTLLKDVSALCLGLVCLLTGCSSEMPRQGSILVSVWRGSPNFGARRPNYVVLHYTSDETVDAALRTLTDPNSNVSAHYLVDRQGLIVQLVDERERAWHAGVSRWGSDGDLNSASIGIELDNDGSEPYPEAEIQALIRLLSDLRSRYLIPARNFLGHSDVAPGRKIDPGPMFPWRRLATAGFGVWCDPPFPQAPSGFDRDLGLAAFGYDTRDLDAAWASFRLHFETDQLDAADGQEETNRLFCVLRRAREATDSGASGLQPAVH